MVTPFDGDSFVASCHDALKEADVVGAIRELVHRAVVTHGSSIGRTITTLHSSEHLTVQCLAWGDGALTDPHDHRMWAVVGVYAGEERNRFYERTPAGLRATGARTIGTGEAVTLEPDVIHDAASGGGTWVGGLHVYGGDLFGTPRSAWDPSGVERPYEEVASGRRRMVACISEVASAFGRELSTDDRRVAMLALWNASDRAGQHLPDDAARQVIADALGLSI